MKLPTREQFEKRRAVVMADAQMKLEVADWHGCADACMDLREIEACITLFDVLREHGALIGANVLEQAGVFAPACTHADAPYTASDDSFHCRCGMKTRARGGSETQVWIPESAHA